MKLNEVINEAHIGKQFRLKANNPPDYEFTGTVVKVENRLEIRKGWQGYIVGSHDIWKEVIPL